MRKRIIVINLGGLWSRVVSTFAVIVIIVTLIVSFVCVSTLSDAYISTSNDPKGCERIIIIDPGHGGEDSGAVGVNGRLEKDLNLEIAMTLGQILRDEGYTVVFTRTTDRMLYSDDQNIKGMRKLSDLKNRCGIADEYPNALFISVHMNTFGASKYSGLQVYYSDNNAESKMLADKIQMTVKDRIQPENNRGTKNGKSLYILDNCRVTTVLVECGFLSNAEEAEKLSQKEYQNQLSFAIGCGIIEYIKGLNEAG